MSDLTEKFSDFDKGTVLRVSGSNNNSSWSGSYVYCGIRGKLPLLVDLNEYSRGNSSLFPIDQPKIQEVKAVRFTGQYVSVTDSDLERIKPRESSTFRIH